MPRAHRPLVAVVAVLIVAAGLAANRHDDRATDLVPASAAGGAGGRGFAALPDTISLPVTTAEEAAAPPPGRWSPAPRASGEPQLRTFSACDAFLDHVRTEGLTRVGPYGIPGVMGGPVAVAEGSAAAVSGGDAGGTSFSTTNVQEADVDEPDVVKNDGSRVFTLFDGIVRAHVLTDDGLRAAATAAAAFGYEQELLLAGDRLVLLSQTDNAVRITIFDGADPDQLRVTNDYKVEGHYVTARLADGAVRIVTTARPALPFTGPDDGTEEERARAIEFNRGVVTSSVVDDWVPSVEDVSTGTAVAAVGCDALHAPTAFSGFATTSVLTLDPQTGTFGAAASVLSDAHEVYASPDNLYVATAAWPEDAEGDPSGWVAPQATQLHQFDITDRRRAVYVASGVVSGHLIRPFLWGGGSRLAQWALSEHDGHLRVANTTGAPGASAAVSSVTVLRRDGRVLAPVGVVAGLGEGERIYAVRFMGTRGYVVTYREVDPLYVVDLTNPAAPELLGELKVPGFSAYLHPIAADLLLGVGQEDANQDGFVEGLQVSLFDVSDPRAPTQVHRLSLGERGTRSDVEWDHRAFMWWPDPGRAVLPVTDWNPDGFVGATALTVAERRIVEVGRVAHPSENDEQCRFDVRRSRVIGDAIYTFSAAGIWVNTVDDFEPVGSLRYGEVSSPCHRPPDGEPPPSSTTTTTTTLPLPT